MAFLFVNERILKNLGLNDLQYILKNHIVIFVISTYNIQVLIVLKILYNALLEGFTC